MSDDKIVLTPTDWAELPILEDKSHDDWLDDMVYMLRAIKSDHDSIISAYVKGDQYMRNKEMEDKE